MSTSLQIGDQVEITIDGVGSAGEGVGRASGRAVFVPYTVVGERVHVRIVHIGKRRLMGEVVDLLEASPQRVEPVCPVFGRCGGCSLMHMDLSAQLELKRTILGDNLRSVAGMTWPERVPIAESPNPLGYRNRGQYPVALFNERVEAGFFAARSHRVVPTERCLIHNSDLDLAVRTCVRWAGRKRVSVYDERSGTGWLRHLVVRRAQDSGQLLVSVVATTSRHSGLGELVRVLRKACPELRGLVVNVNRAATNVILGTDNQVIWGQDSIEERIDDLRFRLQTGSFFQVNTPQARVLFHKVRAFMEQAEGPIVDAYCGVGVLACVLAQAGHSLVGIEIFEPAVRAARRSSEDFGLGATYHLGRVERVLPRLVDGGLRPAGVVLDPPRKGCERAVLEAVARSGCQRIAYLSCHPGSLARDLARLCEMGFELTRLEAVDMFPQTAHLETFAGLVRSRS